MAHIGQKRRFGAACSFGKLLRFLQVALGRLANGNVFNRALEVEKLASRIAHFASTFRNPDHLAVKPVDLRFKCRDAAVFTHHAYEIIATTRIDVKLTSNISKGVEHGIARGITVDGRQRGIGRQVVTIRRRLKDAPDRVFKHSAIEVRILIYSTQHRRHLTHQFNRSRQQSSAASVHGRQTTDISFLIHKANMLILQ